MINFGLIAEGQTNQVVIENILVGYFNNFDIVVNPLLPLRDETDRYRVENYSNWLKVFEYCASSKFRDVFQFNKYLIVQIDTDVSEEVNYNIYKYEKGEELSPEKLIDKVVEKFKGLIGEEFYSRYEEKIIFAISVHSMECWLLPLYYTDEKQAAQTKGCFERLRRQLKRGINKSYDEYDFLSREYCKNKVLIKNYLLNPSLKVFLEEIQRRNIVIEDEEF
jgi:hypothetical protein